MNSKVLLKNLIIGFIPLFVFIIADEFFSNHYGEEKGMRYALILAISIGIIQLLVVWAKEKRLDKMLLFDTAMIVVLGSVSWVSGNDLFFKLKPALMELIMVILLGVVAFINPALLIAMTGRLTGPVELHQSQIKLMQRTSAGMFFLFLFHTGLIVYAALYMSRGTWAFVSGGLFYILTGFYMGGIFIYGRIRKKRLMREAGYEPMVEIRDDRGRVVGLAPRSYVRKTRTIREHRK